MSYPHINDRRLLQMIPLTTSQEGKCAWELWKDLPQCRSAVAVQARTGQLRTERTKSEKASRTYHSLLGGSAAFSTTGSGRAVATAAASSGPERQDGHPLSTRGPQVPPHGGELQDAGPEQHRGGGARDPELHPRPRCGGGRGEPEPAAGEGPTPRMRFPPHQSWTDAPRG
jgi:hypothetical protein